jgi:hypothetical protein
MRDMNTAEVSKELHRDTPVLVGKKLLDLTLEFNFG